MQAIIGVTVVFYNQKQDLHKELGHPQSRESMVVKLVYCVTRPWLATGDTHLDSWIRHIVAKNRQPDRKGLNILKN